MPRNPAAGTRTGSGNPHRCHVCNHRVGPRGLGRVAKDSKTGQQKKAPCNHECHSVVQSKPTKGEKT